MPRYAPLVVLLLSMAVPVHGQFCETVTDSAWMVRYDKLFSEGARATVWRADSSIIDVPVMFHVQTQGGNPVIGVNRINQALAATNAWFAAAGVRFVRCGDVRYYPDSTAPATNSRAVNVAMFRSSTGCGWEMGGNVSINVSCNRTLENILSHELGHVLGLPHTHGYTNTGTTDELADGSNCATHGDRFCDTPADPNLLGVVNGACQYVGTRRDANNMPYAPNPRNIMSYTNSSCADELSSMQLAYARAVAIALRRECCELPAPRVRDTLLCAGEQVLITAEGPGQEFRWYDALEGGTLLATGRTFATPVVMESRAWYVEAVDSCISTRSRVVVRVASTTRVMTDLAQMLFDPDTSRQSSMWVMAEDGRRIVFRAQDASVWVTDGTLSGSAMLVPGMSGDRGSIASALLWNDALYYGFTKEGGGPSLHRVDLDTKANEVLLELNDRSGYSNFWLTELNGAMLFLLNDGHDKAELWRSDGTRSGTQRLAHFPHTSAFNDFDVTVVGTQMLLEVEDSLHGSEPWITDGTVAGTRLLKDIAPGAQGSDPAGFTESDGKVYFSANDGSHGTELWVTDLTEEGTRLLADIRPGSEGSQIGDVTSINGLVYMYVDDGTHSYEPYVTDGTPEGTRLLADIRKGQGSFPSHFTALGDRVFCVANDGSGAELWELFPAGGATLVKDIHPFSGAGIQDIFAQGSLLFFSANDGAHGNELWCSDGSAEGTRLVADIDSAGSSSPGAFTVLDGRMVFIANGGSQGAALYTLAALDAAACAGGVAVLEAGNTDGVIRWFADSTAAQPLGTGRRFVTPPLTQAAMYWAEVAVANCVSPRVGIPVRLLAPIPVVTGPTVVPPGSDVRLDARADYGMVEWHARTDGSALLGIGGSFVFSGLTRDTVVYVRSVERDCGSDWVTHAIRMDNSSATDILPQRYDLAVWPQPARSDDVLHIAPSETDGEITVRIHDVLGRERIVLRVSDGEPVLRLRPSTHGLTAGWYVLNVRWRDRSSWRPILLR
ncbi:MAG TPA: hypothetical protein PK916_12900 [Bacteroidota bacterium]|nr:hypothetical protein [Bacteroidota bacterium]